MPENEPFWMLKKTHFFPTFFRDERVTGFGNKSSRTFPRERKNILSSLLPVISVWFYDFPPGNRLFNVTVSCWGRWFYNANQFIALRKREKVICHVRMQDTLKSAKKTLA